MRLPHLIHMGLWGDQFMKVKALSAGLVPFKKRPESALTPSPNDTVESTSMNQEARHP